MQVVDLGRLDYGNPDAAVSLAKRRRAGMVTSEVEVSALDIIASGQCSVPVARKDDGCIDGRPTVLVIETTSPIDTIQRKPKAADIEHRRPLLAGGGYVSLRPAYMAVYGKGNSALDDLRATVRHLQAEGFVCGAHTGSRVAGDATDCGATDKFEAITSAAVAYRSHIENSVRSVYDTLGLAYHEERFARAVLPYVEITEDKAYFVGLTGVDSLQVMTNPHQGEPDETQKFVPLTLKRLGGEHQEAFIYVNFANGMTFDQAKFLRLLQRQLPDADGETLPQVFVVDIWRVRELAGAIGETAEQHDVAFMAALIYQFATAATLTDGSLRVVAGIEQPARVAA